jgi:tetratricopeptide (TPR) repeat protein
MKVAHVNQDGGNQAETLRERIELGRTLESESDYEGAEKIYLSILKKKPTNEEAYHRLMIIYRKMKENKKELDIIDKAVDAFSNHDDAAKSGSKVHKLSMALGKSTGLLDKKGKSLFDPEPVATWKRRKTLLQKKLKSKKK